MLLFASLTYITLHDELKNESLKKYFLLGAFLCNLEGCYDKELHKC